MKKKTWLSMILFIFVVAMLSGAVVGQRHVKTAYLQHVKSEAGLTQAYTWYKICNPANFGYSISDSSRLSVKFNETENSLRGYGFAILSNVSKQVTDYSTVCNSYNISAEANASNPSGSLAFNNCSVIAVGNRSVVEQKWVPFSPVGQTLKANTCYDIKVEGNYPAKTGQTAIDNVVSYAGFTFSEFAWWNVSYNTSFRFWLKEPNGTTRTYAPLRVNITGISGKIDNCSNGVLTQNISGSLVEIPSEVVLSRVGQGGSCYIRFLANLSANENASFVFFTNASVTRPKYLSGWSPQLWYNQPWGPSAFAVWDDAVVAANGTVVYQGLDMRAGGWSLDYGSGDIVYDAGRSLRDRGGSTFIFSSAGGGCGVDAQCKMCMYLNSTDSGDGSQGHHTLDALDTAGGAEISIYDYPGVSSTYYGYGWGGPNFVSNYPKSKQWVWLCGIVNSTKKQVWIGPKSEANTSGTADLIGKMRITSNGDAGTYHWSKDRMASNNSYNVYNESDYPVFAMGLEETQAGSSGSITESEARTAMEQGINSSVLGPSASKLTDQKIFSRNLVNAQVLGRFDKVAIGGNQRWAFNYVTVGDTNVNMFNLTPVLYTLEMSNLNSAQITDMVSKLINNTKQ